MALTSLFLLHMIFIWCTSIFIIQKPGAHVLYLGAASGTTVSHVSDVVGPVSNS